MADKLIHIKISREVNDEISQLVKTGLYSNKNEIIREAIRNTYLKYKDEIKK